MLYRVHVAVLRVLPATLAPGNSFEKADWQESVAHTFGVNAPNAAEATRIAVEAAEGTVDRNGEYMGGLVVETACRVVDPKEFDGYEKYFHGPINERGIFYVSGSNVFFLPGSLLACAITEVKALQAKIMLAGAPPTTFMKPQLPDVPVEKMRLLCSVCKRWVETDSEELMHLFMKDMHSFTIPDKKIWRSINVIGPFMRRHTAQCLFIPGGPRGMVHAIHPPDAQWNTLDPEKEEIAEESTEE